ncbi:SLATT domain-containing protein [Anaerobacillus sp. MEB173]|uniref:SLATT domain-containing protein n=1 Tax=Anaerobacillus sp. MEB173 TaxID=3383345 RepID=UPI003F8E1C1A
MGLEKFKETISDTRKARILAAERYKKKENFYHFINIYYAVFLVVLSIINLNIEDPTGQLAQTLLIFSILAFTFSIVIYSLNLKEKYFNFKNNYIALSKLYSEIENIDNSKVAEYQLEKIKKEYNILLETCENHDELDYYNYIYFQKREKYNKKNEFKKIIIKSKIYLNIVNVISIKIILIILPWLIGYLLFYIKDSLEGLVNLF